MTARLACLLLREGPFVRNFSCYLFKSHSKFFLL